MKMRIMMIVLLTAFAGLVTALPGWAQDPDELQSLVDNSAEEEEERVIAQANAPLNQDGTFQNERIKARDEADYPVVEPGQVDLMDVAPNQIASISASLIPFLEHDDANRALMGSNMMRQAVPVVRTDAPIVGTGMEEIVAKQSGWGIYAEEDGVVEYVDGIGDSDLKASRRGRVK